MDIREDIKMDGIQEGIQEGIKRGRREVVLNMLKNKMDFSLISKVTGLSKEEIDKIKENHK